MKINYNDWEGSERYNNTNSTHLEMKKIFEDHIMDFIADPDRPFNKVNPEQWRINHIPIQ
jgi:hypothetical protein